MSLTVCVCESMSIYCVITTSVQLLLPTDVTETTICSSRYLLVCLQDKDAEQKIMYLLLKCKLSDSDTVGSFAAELRRWMYRAAKETSYCFKIIFLHLLSKLRLKDTETQKIIIYDGVTIQVVRCK